MHNFSLIYEFDYFLDVESALIRYDKISLILSNDLNFELRRAIEKIQKNPFARKVVFSKDIRRMIVHKFPYKVYYKTKPDKIIILALIHTSRSSKFIKNKLK